VSPLSPGASATMAYSGGSGCFALRSQGSLLFLQGSFRELLDQMYSGCLLIVAMYGFVSY
jgi:hypothetical protein